MCFLVGEIERGRGLRGEGMEVEVEVEEVMEVVEGAA